MITSHRLATHNELITHTLGSPSGLHFHFMEGGKLHSIRHGDDFLINLVLGCPLAGSLQRLSLEIEQDGEKRHIALLEPGAQTTFAIDKNLACWKYADETITATVTLTLESHGWAYKINLTNHSDTPLTWRAFHGLDVGLAPANSIRINEAYTSQYIDHTALQHTTLGTVIASRQNQAIAGKHPVLLQACSAGAASHGSDGRDAFGSAFQRDQAFAIPKLSGIRQGEMSYVSLISPTQCLKAHQQDHVSFFATFIPDHPDPTSSETLQHLVIPHTDADVSHPDLSFSNTPCTLFENATVLHGSELSEEKLHDLFAGKWELEERSPEGKLWSFFTEEDSHHVVTKAKESVVTRSHATILRSGEADFPSTSQLSTTCYAAGIFNSLLSAGHVSFHRCLSHPRENCGLLPSSGQRIWIDHHGHWRPLGIPSAFEMGLTHARWIYHIADHLIQITTRVHPENPECRLEIAVIAGAPIRFLITHGLIGGINEYDAPAEIEIDHARATVTLRADAQSEWRKVDPNAAFQIKITPPAGIQKITGSHHAMLMVETQPTNEVSIQIKAHSDLSDDGAGESWLPMAKSLQVHGAGTERLRHIIPWFVHNGIIHLTSPHGIEQYNGGAWGCRDVTQGSIELLLSFGHYQSARQILLDVYAHQYANGHHWPQWFMLEPFGHIAQSHSHGDIPLWPLKALCLYMETTSHFSLFEEELPWLNDDNSASLTKTTLKDHVQKNINWLRENCIPGTALLRYGDGDWNDSLQPAKPELRDQLVSAWTVALCYQVVSCLDALSQQSGIAFDGLAGFADAIRKDFHRYLVIDDTVCGFYLFSADGKDEKGTPMLHPSDRETGIHYRLLPMTRSIIGGLFTQSEANHHQELITEHLLAADGARLMERPPRYQGGKTTFFQRAETSPCFSREIGIFYTHAHLRYIEAMARMGKADAMWEAIGKANPAAIKDSVLNALPRQANAYFSSSDAVVATRYEADANYHKIKSGEIPVEGGWRIYSSGPGIFLHLLISSMAGIRKRYHDIHIDPVLPKSLDGLNLTIPWEGKPLHIHFQIQDGEFSPQKIVLNGTELQPHGIIENPYRKGGWIIPSSTFDALLKDSNNQLKIYL